MEIDFKINDLTDQLVKNPLNLSYAEAKRKYNQHAIQFYNGHTYDPVHGNLGKEYDFFQGLNQRLEFYNNFANPNEKHLQLWIIAWHTNNTGKLNDENESNYEQISNAEFKVFFGKWIYKNKNYLDSSAIYHNYNAYDAKVESSIHNQEGSTWVNQNGDWDIVSYETHDTNDTWVSLRDESS